MMSVANLHRRSRVAIGTVRAIACVMGVAVGIALIGVVWSGWSELTRIGFYTSAPNIAGPGSGVAPQILNTVFVLVLSIALTIPVGLGAGVYFAEYAGDSRFSNMARRATETLATLPSIIVGLFGYALLVSTAGMHPSRLI